MAESSLITITDVRTYRRVDAKITQEKFDSFVMDVQRKNLRNLLGSALYYDLFLSIEASKYTELRDGKTYTYSGETIQYYGLKPMLCYWWLSKYATEGDLFHSNVGAIQFSNNPQQNFETSKSKERVSAGYMDTAQGYANDVIKFLNQNSSTYPLWEGDKEQRNTQFFTFKL